MKLKNSFRDRRHVYEKSPGDSQNTALQIRVDRGPVHQRPVIGNPEISELFPVGIPRTVVFWGSAVFGTADSDNNSMNKNNSARISSPEQISQVVLHLLSPFEPFFLETYLKFYFSFFLICSSSRLFRATVNLASKHVRPN